MDTLWVLLLGGFVGFLSAFLGLGGGVVIVPLLPEILSISSHEAVATSLFTIFLVVSNNCWSFHRQGTIAWPVALVVGPLTAVGAMVSGSYAQHLPGETLRGVLAAVVGVVFLRAVFRLLKRNVVDHAPDRQLLSEISHRDKAILLGVGVFAGLLSGVSGIGAGLVISPLLIQLHLVKNEKVSPTANAIMVFTTFFGALSFASLDAPNEWMWGLIHLDVSLLLASSAFITSHFARKSQGRLPIVWRLGLLTTLLFLLLAKMIWELMG